MRVFRYPFQIDVQGHIATTDTYSEVVRGQIIDVLMTNFNERIMRPVYGSNLGAALFDPTDELVQVDAAQQVLTRVNEWAPRANVRRISFEQDAVQPNKLFVSVDYQAGPFDQGRTLRVPVSEFLSEETPL